MPADITKLTPETKRKMNMFLRACEAVRSTVFSGYEILVTQGWRAPAYQEELYAQGRTKPGKIVTHLRGIGKNPSKHCLGLAFDICFIKDKKAYYPPANDKLWANAAEIARKCGLTAGYFWTDFKDSPHFESDK